MIPNLACFLTLFIFAFTQANFNHVAVYPTPEILPQPAEIFPVLKTELAPVRFIYEEGRVTCVNAENLTFSVHKYDGANPGALVSMGQADFMSEDGKLHILSQIDLVTYNSKPVYILSRPDQPEYYLMYERMVQGSNEQGPAGRILRYLQEDADFEYLYDEKSVTVLDYRGGEFVKFELPQPPQDAAKISPLVKRLESGNEAILPNRELKTLRAESFKGISDAFENGSARTYNSHSCIFYRWMLRDRAPPFGESGPFKLSLRDVLLGRFPIQLQIQRINHNDAFPSKITHFV